MRVLIVTKGLPLYRVPFFESLRERLARDHIDFGHGVQLEASRRCVDRVVTRCQVLDLIHALASGRGGGSLSG